MKLDHIAFRVRDRHESSAFFINVLECVIEDEFKINFDDGTQSDCLSLKSPINGQRIFISDGDENSIVGKWVSSHGGIGGIHHIAYAVEDVYKVMEKWKTKGIKFSSEPIHCENGLIQVFTVEQNNGLVYELIQTSGEHFCKESVKKLMESSNDSRNL